MREAKQALAASVEPEYGQILMSVVGENRHEPGARPSAWTGDVGAVSGSSGLLVATWSDEKDPVIVSVWRGRPSLVGWFHVHTAHLIVGDDGLAVGMTVSAVEHSVPVPPGPTAVEVWVRPAIFPSEVTFVLDWDSKLSGQPLVQHDNHGR